jgi:hypothetical protein
METIIFLKEEYNKIYLSELFIGVFANREPR